MLPADEIDSPKVGSYTAFLTKLWKIVNDPSTDDLIHWTENGRSFLITNQNRFTQELIPKYFKHNNMASFIRQLNMYGFRKVISIEAGGLAIDKGETEFSHPLFIQGQPGLIKQIKRKPQCARTVAATESNPNFSNILAEVQKLQHNQETMASKVIGIKKENELLWREYANMRQKFSKQQQIIEKLVQFLVAMVKSPAQTISPKRKFSHLALEGIEASSNVPNSQDSSCQFDKTPQIPIMGPVIHEVTHSNDGELNFLEKVYPSNSRGPTVTFLKTPSPAAPSPSTPGPSCNDVKERKKNEARVKVEPMDSSIYVIPSMNVPAESNSDDFYSSNCPSGTEGLESVDPLDFEDSEQQTHIINGTNEYNILPDCVVTTLGEDTNIEASYDPDFHPELLKTVNPSIVNPNITVNVSQPLEIDHVTTPLPANTYSNPTAAATRGVTSIKKSPGMGKLIVRPSSSPNAGKMRSFTIGKGANMGGASLGKGKSLSMAKYPTNSQDQQNVNPSELAIPEKGPINEKDWSNYLDEVQSSLDSLQGIFNSGALNVDSSALLSLFGNENDDSIYIPDQEQWPNNPAISGTEVSLYNPSFYDSEEDEIDNVGFGSISSNADVNTSVDAKSVDLTSSLRDSNTRNISVSPPKRPRLIIKKGKRTGINSSTEDDSLSTPIPYLD